MHSQRPDKEAYYIERERERERFRVDPKRHQ